MAEHLLMTTAEVCKLFRVSPGTPARWVDEGKFTAIRTPGGHRRYIRKEVMDFYEKTLAEGGIL